MFITLSFKKSLIVEQFQGNYLKSFYLVYLLWNNLTACMLVTLYSNSFPKHLKNPQTVEFLKYKPILWKILGTKLKGMGISWKSNLPQFAYAVYLVRL